MKADRRCPAHTWFRVCPKNRHRPALIVNFPTLPYNASMSRWSYAAALLLLSLASVAAQSKPVPPAFTEDNAVRILDGLSQSLEGNNPDGFLKAFDADAMPNYNAFRDQINNLFSSYQEFLTHYHLRQVAMEGNRAVLLTDFELQMRPPQGQPFRKQAQLRFVLAWNGKEWKIVDLNPRGFLS